MVIMFTRLVAAISRTSLGKMRHPKTTMLDADCRCMYILIIAIVKSLSNQRIGQTGRSMVRKSISGIGVFALLSTALCLGVAQAAPFESDFQVVKTSGGCTAKLPRESAFVNLVDGQRLPYGTVIKTEADGSAVIRLSSGNGCRISASTTVSVTQDSANKAVVLRLADQGYIRVILDKGFRSTDQLKVETPSATCEALHCDFSVEYKIIGDLKTSIISLETPAMFL